MTLLGYQLLLPVLSPGFSGLMCTGRLAPKHSVTMKILFSLTPALLPLQLRENAWSESIRLCALPAVPAPPLPPRPPPPPLLKCSGQEGAWWVLERQPLPTASGREGAGGQRVSREADCPAPLAPASTLCVLQARRDRSGKTSHGNYGIRVFPFMKSDLPRMGAEGQPGLGQGGGHS